MVYEHRHRNAQKGSGAEIEERRQSTAVVSLSTRRLTVVHLPDSPHGCWEVEERGTPLRPEMEDWFFKAQMDKGRIEVVPGDEIVCRLWTSRQLAPEGAQVRYRIIEVTEHRPGKTPPAAPIHITVRESRPLLQRMDALMEVLTTG